MFPFFPETLIHDVLIYVSNNNDNVRKQELDDMKKRLKEMEDEAVALREMQAKVEKEMGSVQGLPLFVCALEFDLLLKCFFLDT